MKYNYTKESFSVWSTILKILKGICALFKLLLFILSIPYEIYKGIEEIVSAFSTKPQKT